MNMKRFFWISILILIMISLIWAWDEFSAQPEQTFSANLIGDATIPEGFVRADGSHTWDFPADHGPHPEYQTEWWYYTGNLATEDGRRFGYQLTFFRRGLTPADKIADRASNWGSDQVYMGHFALSDIEGERHYDFERFSRGGAGLAGAQAESFGVWVENWEVSVMANGEGRMRAMQDGIELDLILEDEKGIIFQGIDGYSQKGPETGNASYYFSQPRLASTGTVIIDGAEFQVSGLSWMDHEFSTSALSAGQVGWDWFSLQLSDGSDLMVFQIRRSDGEIDPYSSGTVIGPNGETIHLDQNHFEIQVNESWRSATSAATYPAAWTIQIPHLNLSLNIAPYLADQEMNVSYDYWEGAVSVKGTIDGQTVTGAGYVELTGYAATMEGEF
jgi:predicted secreted hydrolase